MNFHPEDLPNTALELRKLPHEARPKCAIFTCLWRPILDLFRARFEAI